MNSDCAFTIGSTHKVCEDYAIANDSADMSFVALADGCSSSKDSDIGARILVKTVEELEVMKIDMTFSGKAYIANAKAVSNMMKLDQTALDATLLMARVEDGRYVMGCYGDGVTVVGYKNGKILIRSVSFLTSYPQYLSYELNPQRKNSFESVNKGAKLETVSINGGRITSHSVTTPIPALFRDNVDDISFIAIMSDGIHSFYEQVQTETSMTNRPVDFVTVIKDLLDIKGRKGCFVHRLFNSFKKSCATKNWHHSDDLSLAVINVE
jgi:serine/threonine protein phosphatase PrpC